jgi:hypothetical protein
MELNDVLVYAGRRYRVVGFDPVSVTPQRVYLRDLDSGEEVMRLYEDLLAAVLRTAHDSDPGAAERQG